MPISSGESSGDDDDDAGRHDQSGNGVDMASWDAVIDLTSGADGGDCAGTPDCIPSMPIHLLSGRNFDGASQVSAGLPPSGTGPSQGMTKRKRRQICPDSDSE